MNEIKDMVLMALAAVGAWIASALGGWDGALAVLVTLIAVDYITGLLVALVWHKSTKTESGAASSTAGFKGLLRKAVMLLVVFVAAQMDKVLNINYVRTAVCMFYIANEGLSILENTAIMGVKYPQFVKNMLDVMMRRSDAGESGTEKHDSANLEGGGGHEHETEPEAGGQD